MPEKQQSPVVAALVLNCNGMEVVGECLRDLTASDYRPLRIYVVDNASTDGSPDMIAREFPQVELIRNPKNLGWSGANNVGIRRALGEGADLVWILNNDIALERDCLSILMRRVQAHPEEGVWGPLIYYYDRRDKTWFAGGRVDFTRLESGHCGDLEDFMRTPPEERYISGCAMLVRREVFERVGLIDERFFIYYEDADFCLRAARAGFGMAVESSARLYHKVSAFSGADTALSPFAAYHTLRSGMLFWRKHLGWWRFHRRWCGGHLGKWVNEIPYAWEDSARRERARAIIDAVWYVLSGKHNALERPPAPEWFVTVMRRRPWLVAELMALHLGGLLPRRTARTKKWRKE